MFREPIVAQLVLTAIGVDIVETTRTRLSAKLLRAGTGRPVYLLNAAGGAALRSAATVVDTVDAQNTAAAALTELIQSGQPDIRQLDALLSLDRSMQPVIDRLLTQYVEGDERLPPFQWQVWQSALRLAQTLFKAYELLLRHIRIAADGEWTDCADLVLGALFHHRKIEFLLRFMRYKKRSTEQWSQLHEMVRFAQKRGLLTRPEATGRPTALPLEPEYLQILLLEAMNCGHFSPREALWAHRWFARWSSGPDLRLVPFDLRVHGRPTGFVVDPTGSEGLSRAVDPDGGLLYFDASPLSLLIEQAIASLRDDRASPQPVRPAVRAGQLALLGKLAILFAPTAVRVERRAERKPVDLAVQAIAGLTCIVELFRKNGQQQVEAMSPAPRNEITLMPLAGASPSPRLGNNGNPDAGSYSPYGPFDAIPQSWQAKDQSDFGCRLRGQIDDLNRVIPGSVIIVRDEETAPWTLSVVRWFRRLMVDHVEIGVEYLGRNPRLVKVVPGFHHDLATGNVPDPASTCFTALFLPPSGEIPTVPIKTLLVPASEFRAGCDMTLLSAGATYRMRLNEPLQQQFDFVWTSFAVIDTWVAPPLQPQ